MRKLKTSDIPSFCRTLKAIGIKDQIQQIAKDANSASDVWDRGFDLLWNIFDIATETAGEKHIYAFLAGPFEMTAEEVADMELPDFLAAVKQLAEENDLAVFFRSSRAVMK